jgi:hypothetical protein
VLTFAHRLDTPANTASVLQLARVLGAAEVTMLLNPSPDFDSSSQSGGHRADTGQLPATNCSLPTPTRKRIHTNKRIKASIETAQSLGLTVRGFTVAADGSFTVDTSQQQPAATKPNPKSPEAAWDEALNDPNKTAIRQKIRR